MRILTTLGVGIVAFLVVGYLRSGSFPITIPTVPPPSVSAPMAVPTLAPGWSLHEVLREGFAIPVPPGWEVVDMTTSDYDTLLESAGELSPVLKESLKSAKGVKGSEYKFFAFDSSTDQDDDGFVTNANVRKVTYAKNTDVESYFKVDMTKIMRGVGAVGEVSVERAKGLAGNGMKVRFNVDMDASDTAPVDTAITIYVFGHQKDEYNLYFTTTPSARDRYASVFDEMAAGFRVLR